MTTGRMMRGMKQRVLKATFIVALTATCGALDDVQAQARNVQPDPLRLLVEEVRAKGWIVYSAKTSRGDWDLFIMRPDGSQRRRIVETNQFNEGVRPVFARR